MNGSRKSLALGWGVGAAACLAVYVLLVPSKYLPLFSCFLLAVLAIAAASRRDDCRKQQVWFAERFGTFENLREAVDTEALRRLRDEQGVAVAVRSLKKQYPRLSLATAARLVKEL